MTDDAPGCPPHRLDVPLVSFDRRNREIRVGSVCSGCGAIYNPNGGGFQHGSKARRRAEDAAATLPADTLERLTPRARHVLTRLRRATRGRRTT